MTTLVRYAIIKVICLYVSKFSEAENTESNKITDINRYLITLYYLEILLYKAY